MRNEAARLDAALRGNQDTPPELSGMVDAARQLESLAAVPPLAEDAKRRARQAFLVEAAQLRAQAVPAHSAQTEPSLLEKIKQALQTRGSRRSFLPSPVLAALLLVVCFLLTLGVLDLASHNALPGDGLYGYKLWRESVSVVLAVTPNQKTESHLRAIRTRNEELRQLAALGRPIPELTVQRLERSLQDVLQIISRLPDSAMRDRLAEIRTLSLETLALLGVEREHTDPAAVSVESLEKVTAAAQSTESLANLGLSDPDAFRIQMSAPTPAELPSTVPSPTATGLPATQAPTQAPTLVVIAPTATPTVVIPPTQAQPTAQPTLVVMPATATLIFIPPAQTLTPTAMITQTAINPTHTPTTWPTTPPTATDPPPVVPTPTEVIVVPTQAPPTPTPTRTPTPFDTPPPMPTPTPIQRGNGE